MRRYARFGVGFALCVTSACGIPYKLEPDASRLPGASANQAGAASMATGAQGQTVIAYDTHIKLLLSQSCLGCHGAGQTEPDLSSYAMAYTHRTESLAAIVAKSMPPGLPLPAAETIIFRAWVQTGASEGGQSSDNSMPAPPTAPNSPGPTEPQPPPAPGTENGVSFAAQIKPLLAGSCAVAGCHNQASNAAGYEFETLTGTRLGLSDGLDTIVAGTMPLGNFPKISAAGQATLRQWLAEGAAP